MFVVAFPGLHALNIMGLHSPESAILSAVIFNALIIVALIPLALRGVRYKPPSQMLRRNLYIYGLGGLVAPFVGIKLIDLLVQFSPGSGDRHVLQHRHSDPPVRRRAARPLVLTCSSVSSTARRHRRRPAVLPTPGRRLAGVRGRARRRLEPDRAELHRRQGQPTAAVLQPRPSAAGANGYDPTASGASTSGRTARRCSSRSSSAGPRSRGSTASAEERPAGRADRVRLWPRPRHRPRTRTCRSLGSPERAG